jgi:hypothetical protein
VASLFGVDLAAEVLVRRPEGVLVMKAVGARNVPRMDLFGLSDCYVKYVLCPLLTQQL